MRSKNLKIVGRQRLATRCQSPVARFHGCLLNQSLSKADEIRLDCPLPIFNLSEF
jgi:hypothetical protein